MLASTPTSSREPRTHVVVALGSVLLVCACREDGPQHSSSTSEIPSSSAASSSDTGTGGASASSTTTSGGGSGGDGREPGPDDPVLCERLTQAASASALIAATMPEGAPLLPGPEGLATVELPESGAGYVALAIATEHTTFAVYARGASPITLLNDTAPIGEAPTMARCGAEEFLRVQHHTHTPATFLIELAAEPSGARLVFQDTD